MFGILNRKNQEVEWVKSPLKTFLNAVAPGQQFRRGMYSQCRSGAGTGFPLFREGEKTSAFYVLEAANWADAWTFLEAYEEEYRLEAMKKSFDEMFGSQHVSRLL